MSLNRDEVFDKVRAVLVEALGVDDEEVVPEATLQGDLGAESIDFLDIAFQLEKVFGIRIPKGELVPDDLFNNPEYVDGGRFTEAGLQQLREAMPHADLGEFEKNPLRDNVGDLFTVRMIVRFVEGKLAAAA
jgi:acyl carrier protein